MPIVGSGHSSPVIAGPTVYVTTAYESPSAQRTLTVARGLRIGLALVALILWMMLPRTTAWWQDAAGGLALAVFVLLAIADEQLLKLARSPARAWLGTAFAAIVGLFVTAYCLRHASGARRAVALALVVIGALVIAGMPGGFNQTRPLAAGMVIVVGAAVVGCLLVLRGVFAKVRRDAPLRPWRLPPRLSPVRLRCFQCSARSCR